MDKNKIVIGVLVLIIAILSCLIAFTLLQPEPDNVVVLDNVTFNKTDFKLNDSDDGTKSYISDVNGTRYFVMSMNYSQIEYGSIASLYAKNMLSGYQSSQINGTTVYEIHDSNKTAYIAQVPLGVECDYVFVSLDPNETAKMASTLRFNNV